MTVSLVFYLKLIMKIWGHKSVPCLPDCGAHSLLNGAVTVVIAARNEAESLVMSLTSILGQSGVNRVILVDDHSDDGTLDLAIAEAKKDHKLEVLSAPELSAGWTGKCHALDYAAQKVTT
ncbi:MAG: glycosyltransferase, partial [Phycisphaerae bacterium]|nr:glycosyltransferase [Phycisphaerae bacterium]